jgi:thiamine-monophosphate kinase
MNELRIVEKLQRLASGGSKRRSGLILGIGDDCAVFRPRSGEDLLLKTDQFIEDIHFRRTMRPGVVGQRALGRALSDIASMGGRPDVCLVSLTVPRDLGERWIFAFYKGLMKEARRAGAELAGGDLAHSDKLYCDIAICGAVPRGKALRRDGARPQDALYVSGALGKPWSGRIEPRLQLGQSLIGRASACMDISDGLALDLHRLCLASKVAAEVERIPVYRGATLERALHGGEDYELLFTMPENVKPPHGVTRIGRIVRGKAGRVRLEGKPLPPRGYDHFASEVK